MGALEFIMSLDDRISGPAGKASNALSKTEQSLKKTGGALKGTGSEADQLVAKLTKLATSALTLAGAFAGAVALYRFTTGLVESVFAAANAARAEALHAEALYRLGRNYDGAESAAKAYDAVIGQTVRTSGQSRESINKLAEQLVKGGVGGQRFNDALERAAMAAGGLGEESADAYVQSIIAAQQFGMSIDAVNARLDKTLGGTGIKAAQSYDASVNRMRENFRDFAKSLNIDPILKAFANLVSMFDATNATGAGLQAVLRTAFGGVANVIGDVAPIMQEFFEQIVIFSLKAAIQMEKWSGVTSVAMKVIEAAVGVWLVSLLPALIAQMWALAVAVIAATWPFLALGAALVGLYEIFTHWEDIKAWFAGVWTSIVEWWHGVDFAELGSALVHGIWEGLKSSASWLWDALKDLARGARDTFKAALGIASPSKVFAELGQYTVEGYAAGVTSERETASAALGYAMAPPSPSTTAAQGVDAAAARMAPSGASNTFAGSVTVNITGVQGAADLENRMPEILATAFEAIGLTLGVGPEASPIAQSV